jgi:hypothetical protein
MVHICGTNSTHSAPSPILLTKHTENDPHDHINTPPHNTHLIKLPPLHMRVYMRHMAVGKHGLGTGRHTHPPPTHRLVVSVTSLIELACESPPTHSPHPPKHATGGVPAPPPMPMHIKHVAIRKHRRCISAAPTRHTAHQVPFCKQNTWKTTPTTTSTAHHTTSTSSSYHHYTCACS